jgi:hypothetical protein
MNIVCMDYDSVTARKRMAVSQCNIFVCFLQGADLAEEVQRRAVGDEAKAKRHPLVGTLPPYR